MNNSQGTLVSVSLDQLRAFELNPRITRNPHYDEIKISIKNRGLDHPPQITQRPGESHYIIANGGNTRLAILNELWQETHDKTFWNITCLFHHWASDSLELGNLHCLLGHLVENELRGSLTFIERALAVQKATEISQSISSARSQAELLQQLNQGGYAVHQSVYSKMMATLHVLLPHIPDLLYGGLTKTTIEKLLALRASASKFWETQCQAIDPKPENTTFDDIFSMAIIPFNGPLAGFSFDNVRDELTGLISQALSLDYNTVALITDADAQKRQSLLGSPSNVLPDVNDQRRYQTESSPSNTLPTVTPASDPINPEILDSEKPSASEVILTTKTIAEPDNAAPPASVKTTSSILPDAIWNIDPVFDSLDALPSLTEQTAWELAGYAGLEHLIGSSPEKGFDLADAEKPLSNDARTYWQLLSFLGQTMTPPASLWQHLLMGSATTPAGFNDDVIIKIFQLIRLLRRLHEKQREEKP